jgi:hypothetical protein
MKVEVGYPKEVFNDAYLNQLHKNVSLIMYQILFHFFSFVEKQPTPKNETKQNKTN